MRDKTHSEQVERWANYIKTSPDWKKELNLFINAQIELSRRFYKNLEKTEEGRKILERLKKARK